MQTKRKVDNTLRLTATKERQERIKRLKKLINEGLTNREELAKMIGVSPITIRGYMAALGIRLKHPNQARSETAQERRLKMVAMYNDGITDKDILSDKLKIRRRLLDTYLQKEGIKTPRFTKPKGFNGLPDTLQNFWLTKSW